jgi:hypothetical protein
MFLKIIDISARNMSLTCESIANFEKAYRIFLGFGLSTDFDLF